MKTFAVYLLTPTLAEASTTLKIIMLPLLLKPKLQQQVITQIERNMTEKKVETLTLTISVFQGYLLLVSKNILVGNCK